MNLKQKLKNKPTDKLIPYPNNPKKHPQEQIDKIAASINKFGFKVPILITQDNEIIAGHGRLKAAKKLELQEVPCIVADDLTKAEAKAFRIADNKLTESNWDNELLNLELNELQDLDIDTELTGFEEQEIQELGRHYFWSNFNIPEKKINKGELKIGGNADKMEKYLGYDLSDYNFSSDYPKQKILNNCVHPEIGKIILESALNETN